MQWFRRAIHAMSASFIAFYILEDGGFWFAIKRLIAIGILLYMLHWGVKRKIKEDRIHGLLRDHEVMSVPSFIWFGFGSVILLMMPLSIEINGTLNLAAIGASCIFAAGLVDPVMGTVRERGGGLGGFIVGFLLASFVYYLFGMEEFSFIGGLAFATCETFSKRIDDDFTTLMGPAAVFLALGFFGYLPHAGLPFTQISLPVIMGLCPIMVFLARRSMEEKFLIMVTLLIPVSIAALLVIQGGWELAALMLAIQIPFDVMAIKEMIQKR